VEVGQSRAARCTSGRGESGAAPDVPELRKIIGEDIKTVQFGWPLGMPVVRKLALKLWGVFDTVDKRFDGNAVRAVRGGL
jgi:hypothetical protein